MIREFLKWLVPLTSLPFGTAMYNMEVFEVARATSLPFGVASFWRMKRVSVETSDAVRSTVPPGLTIPHVSACLVTLRVPSPAVCLLSDDGPGFVSGGFELSAYIWYKCMLSSPRMTRARTMVLSGRVS